MFLYLENIYSFYWGYRGVLDILNNLPPLPQKKH